MILTFAPKASLFGGDVKIGCLPDNRPRTTDGCTYNYSNSNYNFK